MIVGISLSFIGVLTVVLIYKYKNLFRPGTSKLIGMIFISFVAVGSLWTMKQIHGGDIPILNAIVFTSSTIFGMVCFFFAFKGTIDSYYDDDNA